MIGLPVNDYTCLGSITEVVAELVVMRDPVIVEIAAKHPTTESVAAWLRSLPQRDDQGVRGDGPKVEACNPPQRLRIPTQDPNCVERAATYLAIAELIDPIPMRQLATLDTPIGLHTFPVENGSPVILDPRVQRNCLGCGVALAGPGPVEIDTSDAIDWTARIAEASSADVRNGPSRVRRARNSVVQLVEQGRLPDRAEVDTIGWMFAMAERAARRYGSRVLALVRTTARAIADLLDEVLAHHQRNLALELGGIRVDAPGWTSPLALIAGGVGLGLEELNREGLTMRVRARPPRPTTFASLQNKAA